MLCVSVLFSSFLVFSFPLSACFVCVVSVCCFSFLFFFYVAPRTFLPQSLPGLVIEGTLLARRSFFVCGCYVCVWVCVRVCACVSRCVFCYCVVFFLCSFLHACLLLSRTHRSSSRTLLVVRVWVLRCVWVCVRVCACVLCLLLRAAAFSVFSFPFSGLYNPVVCCIHYTRVVLRVGSTSCVLCVVSCRAALFNFPPLNGFGLSLHGFGPSRFFLRAHASTCLCAGNRFPALLFRHSGIPC